MKQEYQMTEEEIKEEFKKLHEEIDKLTKVVFDYINREKLINRR